MKEFLKYANSTQLKPRLGLERITLLLEFMGNPHKGMKYIHVAGTNGKGSVCSYLYAAFLKKRIKAGRYISPNLVKVNERVSVNGVDISDEDMEKIIAETELAAEKVFLKLNERVSQFEIWTAMAFSYFKKEKCDVVILETGLGGRFDATNVIEENIVSVITKIDIDHTEYLGDTKEKIAYEKCGIIKCPKNGTAAVVTTASNKDILGVIGEQAEKKNNKIVVTEEYKEKGYEDIYEIFDYKQMKDIKLSLGGFHQIENACMAIEVLKLLDFSEEEIRQGLMNAKNPARLEIIGENPIMLFDGSHNPDGIRALKKSLDRYFKDKEILYIMASMRDKDILPSLDLLKDDKAEFIFTTVLDNIRARTPLEMKTEAEKIGISSEISENIKDALFYAKKKNKITVICGSLYLYKDFKEL